MKYESLNWKIREKEKNQIGIITFFVFVDYYTLPEGVVQKKSQEIEKI